MLPNKVKLLLKGTVSSAGSNLPIEGASVKVFDDENAHSEEFTTTAEGIYKFNLKKGKLYKVQVKKEGYEPQIYDVTTYNRESVTTIVVNFSLTPLK
jgi:hypothetical protein